MSERLQAAEAANHLQNQGRRPFTKLIELKAVSCAVCSHACSGRAEGSQKFAYVPCNLSRGMSQEWGNENNTSFETGISETTGRKCGESSVDWARIGESAGDRGKPRVPASTPAGGIGGMAERSGRDCVCEFSSVEQGSHFLSPPDEIELGEILRSRRCSCGYGAKVFR